MNEREQQYTVEEFDTDPPEVGDAPPDRSRPIRWAMLNVVAALGYLGGIGLLAHTGLLADDGAMAFPMAVMGILLFALFFALFVVTRDADTAVARAKGLRAALDYCYAELVKAQTEMMLGRGLPVAVHQGIVLHEPLGRKVGYVTVADGSRVFLLSPVLPGDEA